MPDQRLPHDTDAEEAVLGSILIDSEVMPEVRAILKSDDFYRERNGWIFAAMHHLHRRAMPIDQITVAYQMGEKAVKEMGGSAYLSYLVSRVPTPFHAVYYAHIVKEMSERRKLIEEGGKLAAKGYTGEGMRKEHYVGRLVKEAK